MERIHRPRLVPAEERDVVTISDDEVTRMFSACEDWQELLTIAVLAYLGPRRRAAAQVRQRDVDLKRGTMRFQEKGGKVVNVILCGGLSSAGAEATEARAGGAKASLA